MKTYKDIYELVEKGATVTITSHYGNTRTYFKNKLGRIRERFNNCADSQFFGLDTRISNLDLKCMTVELH